MKKASILIAALILAVIALAGCSNNSTNITATYDEAATPDEVLLEVTNNSLNGTWVGTFETWTFKKNGSGKITENNGDLSADFTYELPGDNSIILHVGSADDYQKASCRLSESSLTLTFDDDRYYVLKKK